MSDDFFFLSGLTLDFELMDLQIRFRLVVNQSHNNFAYEKAWKLPLPVVFTVCLTFFKFRSKLTTNLWMSTSCRVSWSFPAARALPRPWSFNRAETVAPGCRECLRVRGTRREVPRKYRYPGTFLNLLSSVWKFLLFLKRFFDFF